MAATLDRLKAFISLPREYQRLVLPDRIKDTPLPATFPQSGDILDGFLVALAIIILRLIVLEAFLKPFARKAMKHKYYRLPSNPLLEPHFSKDRLLSFEEQRLLAKEVGGGLAAEDVGNYFRRRRNKEREDKALHKFVEVAWRLVTHFTVTVWGISTVIQTPFVHDLSLCWKGYPNLTVPSAIYWYYMTEFGMYFQEMCFHCYESRKSDFLEMVIHHISTLVLISGSYTANFIRIGYLVMVCHDVADSLLEIAKLFKYASAARPWATPITDMLFIAFAVVFFLSRLIIFPFVVFKSSLTDAYKYVGPSIALNVLNGFLGVLVALHAFWMSLIIRMAVKMAASGTAGQDERSDDDEGPIEESMVRTRSSLDGWQDIINNEPVNGHGALDSEVDKKTK